jgi:hypothetical protein
MLVYAGIVELNIAVVAAMYEDSGQGLRLIDDLLVREDIIADSASADSAAEMELGEAFDFFAEDPLIAIKPR